MLSTLQILRFRRAPVEGAPQVVSKIPNQSFEANSGDQFIDIARHFQGEGLRFSVSGPDGVAIGPLTGQLVVSANMSWRNGEVTVTAVNSNGSVSQTFRVVVEAVGAPPRVVAQIPDQVFETGSGQQVLGTASYFEGEELRYSVSGSSRASIDATTGRLSYSTGANESDSSVTVSVVNNYGSVSQTFRVVVEAVGAPPRVVAHIPDQVFDIHSGNQEVEAAPYFEGESLSFSVSGPPGISVDSATGILTILTENAYEGELVTVSATNVKGTTSLTFRATVEAEEEVGWLPAKTMMMSSITVVYTHDRDFGRGTVTFHFDQEYPCGQYCNGDWFVVAPGGCRVTAIGPASEVIVQAWTDGTTFNRRVHGCMKNPAATQGWDSPSPSDGTAYVAADNVDPGNTGAAIEMVPGDRIVKAVSYTQGPLSKTVIRGLINRLCPLVCVAEAPPEGSFRPPLHWFGQGPDLRTDFPIGWREDQIRWDHIPSIALSVVNMSTLERARASNQALATWYTGKLVNTGTRNIVPNVLAPGSDPKAVYRRELGEAMSLIGRVIVGNLPQAQKRDAVVGFIQLGIDQIPTCRWGNPNTAQQWDLGRAFPTAFAAAMLPQTLPLKQALALPGSWQDQDKYGIIDEEYIQNLNSKRLGNPIGDSPGATWGQEGQAAWCDRTTTNFEDRVMDEGSYVDIAAQCNMRIAAAMLSVEGVEDLIGEPLVRFCDRNAFWREVRGGGSAYHTFWRALRNAGHIRVPRVAMRPERPNWPALSASGTAVTVTPSASWKVDHNSPITRMDVRYRVRAATESDWTEIIAATDGTGTYQITGLAPNTEYLVAIRYVNGVGVGAWSRNWSTTHTVNGWQGAKYATGRVTTGA